jgi:hypothetical protein
MAQRDMSALELPDMPVGIADTFDEQLDLMFDLIAVAYQAESTPHMFVIDPKGILIYKGALDDRPDSGRASTPEDRNFVDEALTSAMAGRPVETPVTTPYGCAVHYGR